MTLAGWGDTSTRVCLEIKVVKDQDAGETGEGSWDSGGVCRGGGNFQKSGSKEGEDEV